MCIRDRKIHAPVHNMEHGVLYLHAFGIRLKDIVKAQVMRCEQKRKQQNGRTEQPEIGSKNTRAACKAEHGRRKAKRRSHNAVVQRHAAQTDGEAAQDDACLLYTSVLAAFRTGCNNHPPAKPGGFQMRA